MAGNRKGSRQAGSGRTELAARKAAAPVVQRVRHDGFTPARQKTFLKVLGQTGCVRDACRAAGVSSTTAYRWRDRLPGLAERWETALAMASVELEAIAWKRAVEGVEVTTIRGGEVVSVVRKPSDALLRLLLQAANPKKYGRTGGATRKQLLKAERTRIRREIRQEIADAQEPPEDVRARISARLDALRAKLIREDGYHLAADGNLIPPGWVYVGTEGADGPDERE